MGVFTDFDRIVYELVSEYGTTGTYVKVTAGAYNPATGAVESTSTNHQIKVFLADLTLQSNGFGAKYNTEIKTGDKEAQCIPPIKDGGQALVIDPVNDKIIVNNVTYSIVTFKEVNLTGNDPILYSFYLRR